MAAEKLHMKIWLAAVAVLILLTGLAQAQPIRIGVLTDLTGMVSDVSGDGSVKSTLGVIRYNDYLTKEPYPTLKAATAFSSNFRPRPGLSGSTSIPCSMAGVSS